MRHKNLNRLAWKTRDYRILKRQHEQLFALYAEEVNGWIV